MSLTKSSDYLLKPRPYSERDSAEILDWFKLLNRSIIPFRELFSHIQLSERPNIRIPDELSTAWLYLVLSLASSTKDMRRFDDQMVTCNELIEQGIKKIIISVSKVDLSQYAVFPPFEFGLLIAFQLPGMITVQLPIFLILILSILKCW